MKKLSLLFIIIAMISSCEQDTIVNEDTGLNFELTSFAKKKGKIDICHKGKIINVSINSLSAHRRHGDAVDMDGDGYFDLENECSETDCDDSNFDINLDTEEICNNGIDDNCDGNIDEDCGISCDIACASDGVICDLFSQKTITCFALRGSDTIRIIFNDGTNFRLIFSPENETCFNYILQVIAENNVSRCGG